MTAETDIAAIEDQGANTALEVRTALTSVLARADDKTFTVDLNLDGNWILNPADPTLGTHVGDRDYNDARYVLNTSDTVTGTLTFTAGSDMLSLQKASEADYAHLRFSNELGVARWRISEDSLTADDLVVFAYDDSGTFRATVLRFGGTSDLIDVGWDTDFNSNTLYGVADPTAGSHVGDRDYNDARYTLASGGPYLPLTGGTLTGDLEIGAADPTLILDRTTQAGGSAQVIFQTGGDNQARIGLGGTTSETFYVSALTHNLVLAAENTGAGSADVFIKADDSGGVARNRIFINGDGSTQLFDSTGATRISLQTTGVSIDGILSGPADPTAGTHVGDRDYNDARYVEVAGDTMGGDLEIEAADPTLILDRTTQAGGDATVRFDTGGTQKGYLGLSNNTTEDMYLVAFDGDVYLRSQNAGAAAGDIYLQADDASGTLRTRMFVNGDGGISLYDNAGALRFYQEAGYTTISTPLLVSGYVRTGNVNSQNETLYLIAANSGAASQDVEIRADDSGGNQRQRILIDGDGNTRFYDNTGAARLTVTTTGVSIDGILSGPADPTAGSHVGDRDYNDARYVEVAGDTMTGQLTVDQSSTTGAVPVLTLEQADVDEDFIKIIGTSDTSVDRALVDAADFTTPGSIVGWIKVNVQDDQTTNPITDGDYYIPFYAAPSA